MATAVFVEAGKGEVMAVVGDEIVAKVGPQDTNGAWEMFELSGPSKSGPPLHSHPWIEAYYVLDGEVLIRAGGRDETLRPGDFSLVPADVAHSFRIVSDTARFLVMTSGDGAGKFFADVDRECAGDVDMDTIIAVALRNNLTLQGPPL